MPLSTIDAWLMHQAMLAQTYRTWPEAVAVDREKCTVAIAPGGSVEQSKLRMSVDWHLYASRVWIGPTREMGYSEESARTLLRTPEKASQILFEPFANHTGEQVRVYVRWLNENPEISGLYLSTAEYHLPRLMLVFINWWLREGDGRKLYLSALPTPSPHKIDGSTTTNQTVSGEIDRIIEHYGKDGATKKQVKQFFGWY